MTRFLIAPALALATLTAAGGALAESDSPRVDVPREQWMSVAQIAEHFAAQGYDVRSVEARNPRRSIGEPRREDDRLRLDVVPARNEPARPEDGLVDHRVEPLDSQVVEALLVREEHRRPAREPLLRERRPVDRQAAADQERTDAVAGESRSARVPRDAVPDDRDLGVHVL